MTLINTTKTNVLNLIGICKKSKNLFFGSQLIEVITNKKAHLVILATDVAKNNYKKITNKCLFYNVNLVEEFTTNELSKAIGKQNIIAVAITEKELAKKIIAKLGANYG